MRCVTAWPACRRTELLLTLAAIDSPPTDTPQPLVDAAAVAAVAAELSAAASFTLDLEFASESRYVPDLALVQVSWGDPAAPRLALIDPLVVDPRPVVELVANPAVRKVLHAAQGDLALLAQRFGLAGAAIFDTQIAAAFLGLGDQLGYAGLVEVLLGQSLDKAMQYTRWLERPLSPEQLAYATDDVFYLPRLALELETRLRQRGRFEWVLDESQRLAETAARRLPPEDAYLRLGAAKRMDSGRRAALQGLAEWRETLARDLNKPPSWILKDALLIEIAQRRPRAWRDLSSLKELPAKWIERHGRELIRALEAGRLPTDEVPPPRPLTAAQGKRAGKLYRLVEALAREAEVAPRFVLSRSDSDAVYTAWLGGGEAALSDLPLFRGWRHELAGRAALEWLRKEEGEPRQATLEL